MSSKNPLSRTDIYKDENIELLSAFVDEESGIDLVKHFSSLDEIARASDSELKKVAPNIEDSQISSLRAAFSLGAKARREAASELYFVHYATDVVQATRHDLRTAKENDIFVVSLGKARELLSIDPISTDPIAKAPNLTSKQVFDVAKQNRANSIILVKNGKDDRVDYQDEIFLEHLKHQSIENSIYFEDYLFIHTYATQTTYNSWKNRGRLGSAPIPPIW